MQKIYRLEYFALNVLATTTTREERKRERERERKREREKETYSCVTTIPSLGSNLRDHVEK